MNVQRHTAIEPATPNQQMDRRNYPTYYMNLYRKATQPPSAKILQVRDLWTNLIGPEVYAIIVYDLVAMRTKSEANMERNIADHVQLMLRRNPPVTGAFIRDIFAGVIPHGQIDIERQRIRQAFINRGIQMNNWAVVMSIHHKYSIYRTRIAALPDLIATQNDALERNFIAYHKQSTGNIFYVFNWAVALMDQNNIQQLATAANLFYGHLETFLVEYDRRQLRNIVYQVAFYKFAYRPTTALNPQVLETHSAIGVSPEMDNRQRIVRWITVFTAALDFATTNRAIVDTNLIEWAQGSYPRVEDIQGIVRDVMQNRDDPDSIYFALLVMVQNHNPGRETEPQNLSRKDILSVFKPTRGIHGFKNIK
jgi:hypothetical protein